MAKNKIGFYVGAGGAYMDGLGNWMRALDEAGIPVCLASGSYAGPAKELQDLAKASGVPHQIVYRTVGQGYDVPDYNLNPDTAAKVSWSRHLSAWPPELDPELVYMVTCNEPDKARVEWMGEFAFHQTLLAVETGRRLSMFGWSSGEPEFWGVPEMLKFLHLASDHKGLIAVNLHEYSYTCADIKDGFPFKVGRHKFLIETCVETGFPPPDIHIGEWGWEYRDIPDPGKAIEDVNTCAALYAESECVKGGAMWGMVAGFGDIDKQTQKMLVPVTDLTLHNEYPVAELPPINPPVPPPVDPPPVDPPVGPPSGILSPVGDIWSVSTVYGLNVRNSPRVDESTLIGKIPVGFCVYAEDEYRNGTDLWIKSGDGWVAIKYNGSVYMEHSFGQNIGPFLIED